MFIVVFDCYLMVNKVEYKTLQTFVLVIAKVALTLAFGNAEAASMYACSVHRRGADKVKV